MNTTHSEEGALSVFFVLFLVVVTFAGLGVWSVLRNWRFQVQTQYRLDRCIGKKALEFRDHLEKIESTNRRITVLRGLIAAAEVALQWEAIPPLKAALTTVVLDQERTLMQWRFHQGKWLVSRGCGGAGDIPFPLPSLSYFRKPPDPLGPQTLEWQGQMPESFHFQISHRHRHGSAQVEKEKKESILENQSWVAAWTAPRFNPVSSVLGLIGANSH